MVLHEIKTTINKIDYDLKSLIENVYISEKSLGNRYFVEISVNGLFNEGIGHQRRETVVRIDKRDLVSNPIRWSYSTNPLNEDCDWIERVSSLEMVSSDIYDVLKSKKMDSEYFEGLEIIVDQINESDGIVDHEKTLVENVQGILEKYGVRTIEIKTEILPIYEGSGFPTVNKTLIIPHSTNLKVSEMFMIENEIKSLPGVNWCLFKEGFIEIDLIYEN